MSLDDLNERQLASLVSAYVVASDVWENATGQPLWLAFTDMDDHPEQDMDAGFNYNVGFLLGAAEMLDIPVDSLLDHIADRWRI